MAALGTALADYPSGIGRPCATRSARSTASGVSGSSESRTHGNRSKHCRDRAETEDSSATPLQCQQDAADRWSPASKHRPLGLLLTSRSTRDKLVKQDVVAMPSRRRELITVKLFRAIFRVHKMLPRLKRFWEHQSSFCVIAPTKYVSELRGAPSAVPVSRITYFDVLASTLIDGERAWL
jgi:hypothetical protein